MINLNSKYSYIINEIHSQGHSLFKLNGKWVCENPIEVQAIIDTFDELQAARDDAYKRIDVQLQEYFDTLISSNYSRAEQDTFPYQRAEIEAWEKDNSTPTPTIDKIALNRGVSRDVQLAKIASKTALFSDITNTGIGKAQGVKDRIKTSINIEFINNASFEA